MIADENPGTVVDGLADRRATAAIPGARPAFHLSVIGRLGGSAPARQDPAEKRAGRQTADDARGDPGAVPAVSVLSFLRVVLPYRRAPLLQGPLLLDPPLLLLLLSGGGRSRKDCEDDRYGGRGAM